MTTQPVAPLPALMTVPEAARVLGIARSTLDVLIRRGEVESVLIGQRNRRVTGAALAAYLARAVDTAVHAAAAPTPLHQPRSRRPQRRQAGPTRAELDAYWAQFGSRRSRP